MKLIVGLGNPGADYERSRHNVGWMIVDAFAKKFRIDIGKHEKNAMTGEGRVAGGSVKVAKPLTFMNLSGDAVKLLVNAYLESTDDLMIVYDDIDLPLARAAHQAERLVGHAQRHALDRGLACERALSAAYDSASAARSIRTDGFAITSSTISLPRRCRWSNAESSAPSMRSSSSRAAI